MALIKEIHGVHVYLKKVDYTSSGEKEEQFKSVVPTFLAPGTGFMEDPFYHRQGGVCGGWFWDDSNIFHLLCTLFLIVLHHLHLRSSGVRSRRLGTPVLAHLVSGPKQDQPK